MLTIVTYKPKTTPENMYLGLYYLVFFVLDIQWSALSDII